MYSISRLKIKINKNNSDVKIIILFMKILCKLKELRGQLQCENLKKD